MGCNVRSPGWFAYLRLAVCLWMLVMGSISARYSIIIKAHPEVARELYPDSVLRGHTLAATFVRLLTMFGFLSFSLLFFSLFYIFPLGEGDRPYYVLIFMY